MSAAVSSSRGNTRPTKEKHGKSTPQSQIKSEGPPLKIQATPEQIRLAQLTNDTSSLDDTAFKQKVKQVMDITGISEETDVAIALQDCSNDTEKAINMLIEGNAMQGEWKETGKKKKKVAPASTKTEPVANLVENKSEEPEQTPEREKIPDKDRSENISRRGRRYENRFDTRPPRLAARGRGRDRPNRENNDNDGGEFGTFGQDRSFDSRGRGRGRGGRGGSRRGRGRSFNAQASRERPPQKFDKGPQIDTWTNETAENAEKENSAGPWGDGIEDWNEDTWQGNTQKSKLTETKVFESSVQSREPEPMSDSSNTLGQRIDLGALLQKPTNESPDSYLTQYNQQATETIKNTIGIGSASRQSLSSQMGASSLTNHLSSGPLVAHQIVSSPLTNSISATISSPSSAAVDALVSSLTQNSSLSTGVDGGTIDLTALTQNTTRGNLDLTSLSQNRQTVPLDLTSMSQSRQSVPMSMTSQADSISSAQQRPKPQRSKLPPPSKIPASAVEMPGHRSTNKVDVQFGNWESSFGFGNGETIVSGLTSSETTGTQQSVLSNHLSTGGQQQSDSVISQSMMTSSNAGTSAITSQESPRNNMFHNSPYTTPTKKDASSLSQNQMSPPEPIPFPSQNDRKSSPMMAPQRPGSTPGLSQGSLSTSNPESSTLNSFSQGGYGTSPYQAQKSTGLSGTTGLSNSSGLSSTRGLSSSDLSASNRMTNSAGLPSKSDLSQSSYQSQYQSGSNQYPSSQNQFQTGQNQYPGGQNQFHSGQSQYYGQSGSTFQREASSYSGSQGQSGSFSGSQNPTAGYQSNQNSSSSYQGSQTQNGSFPSTQSQTSAYTSSRGSSYPSGQNQSSSFPGSQNASQNPPGAYPGNQSSSGSFNLTGNQNQGSSFSDIKSQSGSYNDQSGQSGTYSERQNQSSSYSDRQSQSAGSGSFGSERTNQTGSYSDRQSQSGSYSDRQSQPGTYPGTSSFSGVTQASQSYNSANQSGQSSLYQAAVSNNYQGQNQPGSIYHQGSSTQTTSYPSQGSTNYGRDSQSGTFSANVTQSSNSYQRDGSSSVTPSSFTTSTFGSSSHQNSLQSNLPPSGLSANKLGETLSKMTVKDTTIDTRQSPSQFETSSSSTTANLTSTTTSTSLISTISTPSVTSSATTTTVQSTSAKVSVTTGSTSKGPPNLPPGVPLLNHQYVMGQNIPYFGLQQPLYGYEDLQHQLIQRGLPPMNLQNLQNYNYDMAFGNVPTTLNTGREQNAGNVPYSGTDNKLNRVEAQSPIPSTQQQSTQSHQHQFINLPYGYCYPGTVLPGAPTAMGFQYPPQMFQVPPVTNTAAPLAGTSVNAQFQKQTYGSHSYGSNKGYDDLTQVTDFTKSTYINQSQNKVSAVSGLLNGSATTVTADLAGTGLTGVTGYGKTQPFATGSQAGSHIGAPTNPYGAAQFIPLMTHQPPSQLHLQGLQQDTSTGSSARIHTQQTTSQAKTVTPKGYTNTYWGTN